MAFHNHLASTPHHPAYHPHRLQPEHAAFAQLLVAPQSEAAEIAHRRFPVPKIVDCDQNGSQVGWRGVRAGRQA